MQAGHVPCNLNTEYLIQGMKISHIVMVHNDQVWLNGSAFMCPACHTLCDVITYITAVLHTHVIRLYSRMCCENKCLQAPFVPPMTA